MYILKTEYVTVVYCSTVLHLSSYMFHSLSSTKPQVQTSLYEDLVMQAQKGLGVGTQFRVNQ